MKSARDLEGIEIVEEIAFMETEIVKHTGSKDALN